MTTAGHLVRKSTTKDGITVSVSEYTIGSEAISHYNYPTVAPVLHVPSTGDTFYKVLLTIYETERSGYDGKHLVISWFHDSFKESNHQLKYMMNKLKDPVSAIASMICEDIFDESSYINNMIASKIAEVDFVKTAGDFIW